MNYKESNIRKLFRILLPTIFILYLGNILLFSHSHVVNGVVIVHSHPFNRHIQHSHTESELETILFLSYFQSTAGPLLPKLLVFIPLVIYALYVDKCCHIKKQRYETGISLRAPPSSIFL